MKHAAVLLLLAAFSIFAPTAHAQGVEVEPNSSCTSPQSLPAASLPYTVTGSLDTPPATPDVDFYRFTAAPGDLVRIELAGQAVPPFTLGAPLLAVLDSSCTALAENDGYGPNARIELVAPADGILIVAATSYPDYGYTGQGTSAGSYRLSLTRLPLAQSVSGRVLNAKTGQPIQFVEVSLARCEQSLCGELAGQRTTGADGSFRFENGDSGLNFALTAGDYLLTLYAPNHERSETEITLAEGQALELGDLALTPYPILGSIRGRIVDSLTGSPLSGTAVPFARVELQKCETPEPWSCWTNQTTQAGSDGTFTFASTTEWPLLGGTYRVRAAAEQYEGGESAVLTVGDAEHRDAGDVRLRSFPVRIDLAESCGAIPSTGGKCRFTARITNGMPARLHGETWTLIYATKPGFPAQLTAFQTALPRGLSLASGGSAVVPFSFDVPAAVADGTQICVETVAAHRQSAFDTLGLSYLFCLTKGPYGFAPLPDAQKPDTVDRSRPHQGHRP
jgi:5-hydroxyisourate hydrolase-like protein (transthyretin family)